MTGFSINFEKSTPGEEKPVSEVMARVLAKHHDAMQAVLEDAKQYAADRRRMLDSISDPVLRRSAARTD